MLHAPSLSRRDIVLEADGVALPGSLTVPDGLVGVVVFAHGSGSSRTSPRNTRVADLLNGAHLGTLLFDLLTPAEASNRQNVFDIPLLARRLSVAADRIVEQPDLAEVRLGYFGASTGAAAALWAAAGDPRVRAIVSRGGRPDLARPRLPAVQAPTLLIVGALDQVVLELNEEARQFLRCENRLELVPGATHLFEEHGALTSVARLARNWLVDHLAG